MNHETKYGLNNAEPIGLALNSCSFVAFRAAEDGEFNMRV